MSKTRAIIAIGFSTFEAQDDFKFMFLSLKTSDELQLKQNYNSKILVSDGAAPNHNAFEVGFPCKENIKVKCAISM